MKRLFMALALVLFMASVCWADAIRVRDFSAYVDIASSGDITVTETLKVEIPRGGAFHGIYRDIPVVTRWRESGRARMEVLSVTLDGRPRPADDVMREGAMVRVYQRDREELLRPGIHEFVLKYRMSGQVGMFKDNDELTWNVTGGGWEAPIGRASCTVICPEGAPLLGQDAWLGLVGSRASDVVMTQKRQGGRQVLTFTAKRAVLPGEQLTVAAGWAKGFVTPKTSSGETAATAALAVFAVLLAVYFFFVWNRYGKDPAKGVIIARFYPPNSPRGQESGEPGPLSPAAVGYLAGGGMLSPRCFGAALIGMAARGLCRISGDAKQGFTLERGEGLSPWREENALMAAFPVGSLKANRAHGEQLHAMQLAMSRQLTRDFAKLWKGGRGLIGGLFGNVWAFLGMVAALAGLAAFAGWMSGWSLPGEMMTGPFALVFLSFFAKNFGRIISQMWRRGKRGRSIFMGLFTGGILSVFAGGLLFATGGDILLFFSPVQVGLMVLILFIPFGFAFIMDAPSVEARALLDEIEGLALYIGMAETDRLNALNPPDQTLEHYQALLPYAVALELEEAWGARFAAALAAHAEQEELGRYDRHDFWTPAMASALSSSTSRSISSYASDRASSESSFGGGGGGGAGSGGGGGGGGGC